jgi:Predicted glycosyltransferases
MSVSIVIPTTLRRTFVDQAVAGAVSAVSQIEGGEVIVVANGALEGRRPLGMRSPRLRVLETSGTNASRARNVGIKEARNDTLLFTDDDCLVSAEWSDRMAQRLRNGAVATATSLKMRRDGPMTTFLDYQRVYHPTPVDAATVRYAVGASIGIRRDLVGVSFDEGLFSGDDAEFGDRVREAGDEIAFVADAPSPIHVMPEDVDSITGRFWRYGRGNAVRFLSRGRSPSSVPHATSLYSSLARNELDAPRRFEEIADPGLRELFATLDLMLLGAFLAGYLSEAGEILGREIVRADPDALADGWGKIAGRLSQEAARVEDWDELPIDFDRWSTPRAGSRPALAGAVAENLTRHAPLTEPAEPDPDLDVWADSGARRAEETWARSNRIWQEVRAGDLAAELEPIASRLRESGIAFREGAQMIETIAQGPIEPAVLSASP